jgi:hypothetical protein
MEVWEMKEKEMYFYIIRSKRAERILCRLSHLPKKRFEKRMRAIGTLKDDEVIAHVLSARQAGIEPEKLRAILHLDVLIGSNDPVVREMLEFIFAYGYTLGGGE